MRCQRYSELRCKEVICLADGRRLGYITDLEIDLSCGKIVALILPGPGKFKSLLSNGEYRVPWQEIASIGADLILVNRCEQLCNDRKRERHH